MRFKCCSILFIGLLFLTACSQGPQEMPITSSSAKALQLYHDGVVLENNGKFRPALEKYNRAIELDPNFAMAHLHLANCYTYTGRDDQFFTYLKKTIELADQASETERNFILSFKALVEGDSELQLQYLESALAQYPNDKDLLFYKAINEQQKQNWDKARELYVRIATLYPDYAPAYNSLAYVNLYAQHYNDAEIAVKKYTQLVPDQPNPWDSYGEILMKQGKFDESVKAYSKVLKIDPEFYSAYAGLGTNYMLMNQHDKAMQVFNDMMATSDLYENQSNARFHMVRCCVDQGEIQKAIQFASEQIQLAKQAEKSLELISGHDLLGDLYVESGQYDLAKKEYAIAKDLVEKSELLSTENKFLAMIGSLYDDIRIDIKTGELDNAAHKINKYEEMVNDRAYQTDIQNLYLLKGMLAIHQENWDQALEALKQANLRSPRVMCAMARAYKGKGDVENAKAMWRQAANFNEVSLSYAFVRKNAFSMLKSLEG